MAERYAAVGDFISSNPDAVHPVVRDIILGGAKHSAVDTFRAQYKLEALRAPAVPVWNSVDFLCLPTTGTTYEIAEVEADPCRLNSNLGYYTNFVNLFDLAAVAIPAGFRSTGLPFGISLARNCRSCRGNSSRRCRGSPHRTAAESSAYRTRRAALKPGLVREESFEGSGIDVEVWSMPVRNFGSFVALAAPPLGIGSVILADGFREMGFICEPYGLTGATEITLFGGWKNWRAAGG